MEREKAMEEARSMAQQQQLMLQQQHLLQQHQQHQLQQHQQNQMLLLQQQIQQQQLQQQARLGSFRRPQSHHQQQQQQHLIPSLNPNPNHIHPLISTHLQNPNPNPNSTPNPNPNPSSAGVPKVLRNPAETQMSYQDLWRVCHPDYNTPFSSLEDACERLLPYHVVADYEAEEDDRILDSDTTGQMPSRAQQWDNNISAKVAEFTETFGKQVLAFNIINSKRAHGDFRMEERYLIEKLLAEEDARSLDELRKETESRQNAGREANLRMVAVEQARAEIMASGPIRPNALGFQGSNIQIGHNIANQRQEVNPEEMINGWGNNAQRDENEATEDFLNDEETENGDADTGEFDLNTR